MEKVSCGVLIFNEGGQLLVAHATDTRLWDIPKGAAEPYETPLEAAVRETLEETGIALQREKLTDLGRHSYLPQKDLHLFRYQMPSTCRDLSACRCTSFFPHRVTGHPTPEVDAFKWAYPRELASLCSPRLVKVIAAVS